MTFRDGLVLSAYPVPVFCLYFVQSPAKQIGDESMAEPREVNFARGQHESVQFVLKPSAEGIEMNIRPQK